MGLPHPFWVISVLALAACRPAAHDAPPPNHDAAPARVHIVSRDPLGLAQGTSWHFHGSVTRDGITTPLAWTTTVATVEEKGSRITYGIVGWPGDAPDMPARKSYLVIENNVVHLSLDGSIGPDTVWFTMPLGTADKCGDDDSYCWTADPAGKGWDLVYRTTPDATLYHVEPGRGVTRYEYHHNGSSEDVVLDRDE